MNKPLKHDSAHWGSTTQKDELLAKIGEIGPILEANADAYDQLAN